MNENDCVQEHSEAYNASDKDIVEIDRVIFKEVNDNELNVINKVKSDKSKQKFFSRMIISAIVIAAIFIFHGVGLFMEKNTAQEAVKNKELLMEVAKTCGLLMLASFIVFNAVSFFYTFVKRQLVSLTENYYILLEAVVSDKYSGSKLAVEGKERKKNYVVFECDQGVCSKALEVDKTKYKNTSVGDKIVVLKAVTVEGYTLSYLKENEYRNIYNASVKNA